MSGVVLAGAVILRVSEGAVELTGWGAFWLFLFLLAVNR